MKQPSMLKPLTNSEIASFCSQMAMILKAGISPVEGLSIMKEDTGSREEEQLLEIMEDTVAHTGSFYEALHTTGIFPSYMLHMTNIGEQSGRLDEVMDALSSHYDREAGIALSIKNAVTYPLIMITMMIVVILILIMKVLPIFEQVFEQLGREMNGLSRSILDFGTVLNRYSIVLVALSAVIALLFIFFFYIPAGRRCFADLASKLGIFKSFRQKTASCHFASGMALTLSSGLNIDQSFELASELVDDLDFKKKITLCQKKIQEGFELPAALSSSGIFTGLYSRMLTIGFRTGSTDEMLRTIASKYEDEIDGQIGRNISILEPTLVAILSVVVGVILLSVMLPLIGIMAGF